MIMRALHAWIAVNKVVNPVVSHTCKTIFLLCSTDLPARALVATCKHESIPLFFWVRVKSDHLLSYWMCRWFCNKASKFSKIMRGNIEAKGNIRQTTMRWRVRKEGGWYGGFLQVYMILTVQNLQLGRGSQSDVALWTPFIYWIDNVYIRICGFQCMLALQGFIQDFFLGGNICAWESWSAAAIGRSLVGESGGMLRQKNFEILSPLGVIFKPSESDF